jgi:hypothetical protein
VRKVLSDVLLQMICEATVAVQRGNVQMERIQATSSGETGCLTGQAFSTLARWSEDFGEERKATTLQALHNSVSSLVTRKFGLNTMVGSIAKHEGCLLFLFNFWVYHDSGRINL